LDTGPQVTLATRSLLWALVLGWRGRSRAAIKNWRCPHALSPEGTSGA